jgi:hypothetical protein
MVDGDLRPEDNILYDTFYVRGGRRPGGRVLSFRVGPDTIDTLAIVVPRAVVENNGQGPATFWTWVNVWSPSAHVYSESVQVMLGAGGRIGITFPTARFTELGMHIGRCSLDCDTWATLDDTFWVVAGHGIEERSTPDASRATPGTTLVRGVLFLGAGKRGQSTTGQSLVFLLDAAGRTVMALKPGGNDVRHLPAGVYFIRPAGTVPTGQGAVPIRAKVVIQR